jgi:signal transduction histidine kinase
MNVAKHARASDTVVAITVRNDELAVTISDDGAGLSGPGRRSGIVNMEERAVQRGGAFSLQARHSGGTELTWTVPLHVGRTE